VREQHAPVTKHLDSLPRVIGDVEAIVEAVGRRQQGKTATHCCESFEKCGDLTIPQFNFFLVQAIGLSYIDAFQRGYKFSIDNLASKTPIFRHLVEDLINHTIEYDLGSRSLPATFRTAK
jgi:hypothetical protein